MRRTLLAELTRKLGTPEAREQERALPGDELLLDALASVTQGITIAAPPERIWPWLVQMGCRRAGFYSIDWLDNGGVRSAREIHPEWQNIRVGERLPATPEGADGFEVLRVDEPRALILGGLYDDAAESQLPFEAKRPERYWQVTWAFVLEPLSTGDTRLIVRARAAFPAERRLRATAIRFVHHFMEESQLRHLAARAEGRLARDDLSDVIEGIGGAALMSALFLTPFLRAQRSHWGLTKEEAARVLPGDSLVASPRWGWSHAMQIDARPATV